MNLVLKEVEKFDVLNVVNLARQQEFQLFDIDNCIVDKVVYNDGRLVAYGIVKEMSEAIILVNYEVPKISRMKALVELMKVAIIGAKNKGHKQLHVFVKDEELAKLLENKFHFIRSQDIVLIRNL